MTLAAGTSLGPYEILAPLGAGGMGQVFKARDARLGREVAIKVLPPHLSGDPVARERMRREAIAAAALDHPFICKVFEIGEVPQETGGAVFIVMEFVRGETLHARLSAGPMPLPEALTVTSEIVEALEAAHARRIVHRDLKPANVMISAQGHVKVMDFGLAKDLSADAARQTQTVAAHQGPLTGQGERVGTPAYMSPEQIVGDALDARSDIFSLGVLVCELVSGIHPFQRPTMAATVSAVLQEAPVIAPPASVGDLPSSVRQILHRMLAKAPADRYQTMSDVRRDLMHLTASTGTMSAPIAAASADKVGQTRRWPMVGREAERGELITRLEEALAGRGSLVLIGGEPGIGKTRLTESVLDEARRRGCLCLVGHAYEMEGAPPYVPFIEMLEYSARVVPAAAFRHALGDGGSEIAKLLPDLQRMFPDIPPGIAVPPEQQRWRLFNAYRDFVVRSCQMSPIVVVLEDLHWADEPTLQLLLHVAPGFAALPLLVLGTYRDVELDVTRPFAKVLETLIRQRHATRMALRRLPAAGVDALLTAMSGRPAPASLARVIFQETEGNPFFVEEVFQHLREEGRVFDDRGEWRTDLRVDALDVPEGVRLVIGRRLERLSEATRRALTVAAVIGRSFSLPLLEALDDSGGDAILDAVEEAERAHLLAPQRVGREMRYLFAHELIRQTLADALSLPRRQRLHARIAAAIERVYAGSVDKHVSALAHHLYQAGAAADAEKTSAYLIKAADEARTAAAHEDALRHVDHALSLWEEERSDRVADLLERRALALRSLGRPDEAIAALSRAAAMWDAGASAARLSRTGYELGATLGWQARPADAVSAIDAVLHRLSAAPTIVRAPLEVVGALWQCAAGDGAGLEKFERIRDRAAQSPELGAMVRAVEPHLRWFLGDLRGCIESSRAVAEASLSSGQEWLAADVEWMGPLGHCFGGRPAAARAGLDEMEQRAVRVGHHGARVVFRQLRGIMAVLVADFDAAVQRFVEAGEIGRAAGSPWVYFPNLTLGTQACHLGRFDEGLAQVRAVVEIEPDTYWCFLSRSYLLRLLASVAPDDAEAYLSVHRFRRPQPGQANPHGVWSGLSSIVEALGLLGRRGELADLLPIKDEGLQLGMAITGAWPASMLTCAGVIAGAADQWDAASVHFADAIAEADTLPVVTSQPAARTWFAEMLRRRDAPADRDRARALLGEAVSICERHGMALMGRRAQAMLSSN